MQLSKENDELASKLKSEIRKYRDRIKGRVE